MDDEQGELDALEVMKDHEVEMILDRVKVLRERLEKIKELINSHTSGDYVPINSNDGRPENVYFIMPDIMHQFGYVANADMPMMEFVGYFEKWIARLQCAMILNGHLLKNKALMSHMQAAFTTCSIIDFATKAYFDDPDNGL